MSAKQLFAILLYHLLNKGVLHSLDKKSNQQLRIMPYFLLIEIQLENFHLGTKIIDSNQFSSCNFYTYM
jgi:hypothetical protein